MKKAKEKDPLLKEVYKYRAKILLCNIRIILWFLYGMFQAFILPMTYTLYFKNGNPLLILSPIAAVVGIYAITQDGHISNVKIKTAEESKKEMYRIMNEIQFAIENAEEHTEIKKPKAIVNFYTKDGQMMRVPSDKIDTFLEQENTVPENMQPSLFDLLEESED